jgi:hypothetical protein
MPGSIAGVQAIDVCAVHDPDAGGPPRFDQAGFAYAPCVFNELPHDVPLDASDCTARAVTSCDCSANGTTETSLNRSAIRGCVHLIPSAYVAFNDAGCATDIRYGDTPPGEPPSPGFEDCLRAAAATERWGCANAGTHFLAVPGPYGGPPP